MIVQVLTVYETKYPHCLDPHTLETLGVETLNGTLKLRALAAHFRLDMIDNVSIIVFWLLSSTSNLVSYSALLVLG